MAYGVRSLSFIQIGKETTAGTEANATTIWRGEGTLVDESPIEFVKEDVGLLQDQGRTYQPYVTAALNLDKTPCTFEQFPYLLSMGVDASGATGAADTGGSGYVYTFTLNTNAVETVNTYTLEGGDNSQEYQATYGFCEEFTLAGSKNEAVTMTGKLRARQFATGTKTASLSVPTVDEVLFNKGKIYIDSTTVGTTVKAGTWLGFSLKVPTGFQPVYTGDGQLYFSAVKQTGVRDITGELVLEHDATGVAEVAFAQAETTRLISMVFEGPALVTSGAAYTYKTLRINLAIKYTKTPELKDQAGDNVLTFPFKVIQGTSCGVFTVVNSLSALT